MMFWNQFSENRNRIEEQYRQTAWDASTGLEPDALREACSALEAETAGESRTMQKAKLFAFVLDRAQLAVVPEELFQDHIRHEFIVHKQRGKWREEAVRGVLREPAALSDTLAARGVLDAHEDFGHTVPDWYAIMELGIPGLLDRARKAREKHPSLSESQRDFYAGVETVLEAARRYLTRLAALCRAKAAGETPQNAARLAFCAVDLDALAAHAPQTLHQALQLAYVWHILQEEIEGERLRSLGGLDRLYLRFMRGDLESGRLTRGQMTEMWQDFFQKFHALTGDTLYGEPMYLGGTLPDGSCAVNEFTFLILRAYDALSLANPKFHIRWSPDMPRAFTEAVLDCIRRGNSSFVFISDSCAIPMMQDKVGATLEEAREFVPVGCYEPGILGREVACTGNGAFSLPKALELALNDGVDPLSGLQTGPKTGACETFDTFEKLKDALKAQIAWMARVSTGIVCAWERSYMLLNPSPLFSSSMVECVERGMDAYAGGAKYNNSSMYVYGNGTLADSLAMIDKLVYQSHQLTLGELNEILLADWKDHDLLRMRARRDPDKWGNNRALPDALCAEMCKYAARLINETPNARGGHFKAALVTIDKNYPYGQHLGASADGRMRGEPISRNMGAVSTMDRCGVTAMIESACKVDMAQYPTGSVLDIMLHPSAVAGADGLEAFYRLLVTYFEKGGYAIHGNVMDAAVLRQAQAHPEKYPHLQVRVCGWNVYFVNLSKEEQDDFIARAEA